MTSEQREGDGGHWWLVEVVARRFAITRLHQEVKHTSASTELVAI